MCPECAAPTFDEFLRFMALKHRPPMAKSAPPDRLLAAARAARDEWRASNYAPRFANHASAIPESHIEAFELLAASSNENTRPSELVTVRGFKVRLDYRDGTNSEPSSIAVLIQCPQHWINRVQGRIAFLWNGIERFELGEFDADGKVLGALPAGIEITLADFATGQVKLETPDISEHG